MPANYVLISKQTVSQSVASVTLSNIPQTGYTDLKIVVSARRTSATDYGSLTIGFNGSSSSFTNRILVGTGSAAVSSTQTTPVGPLQGTLTTTNTFISNEIYIPNYTSSTNKSYSFDGVLENNAAEARTIIGAGIWSATPAAITSVTLGSDLTGDFAANSTFSIYGIAALGITPTILPKATGGDIIQNDGTYWYHAFISSGIFTPASNLSCQYLVIAGGGGGGGAGQGGGGGSGGYRSSVTGELSGGGASAESAANLTALVSYAMTIGSGGAGASGSANVNGTNGNTSSIAGSGLTTISSVGGGGGGWQGTAGIGSAGGSGGGAGSQATTGGAGTTAQGYRGGQRPSANYNRGQGGGGAGAVGGFGDGESTPGNGGVGVSSSITGTATFRAGGGGGGGYASGVVGLGGNGGGGNGSSNDTSGVSGTVNTGGGGGGTGNNYTAGFGGNGGSGIVIVRYTMA